jgi:hypothetical protein
VRLTPQSGLGTATSVAWVAATVLIGVVISSRGHERKLIGSYQGQTAWMRMNKIELTQTYRLKTKP